MFKAMSRSQIMRIKNVKSFHCISILIVHLNPHQMILLNGYGTDLKFIFELVFSDFCLNILMIFLKMHRFQVLHISFSLFIWLINSESTPL